MAREKCALSVDTLLQCAGYNRPQKNFCDAIFSIRLLHAVSDVGCGMRVFIIIDLDRTRLGVIMVGQEPLINLQTAINLSLNVDAQKALPPDLQRPSAAGQR